VIWAVLLVLFLSLAAKSGNGIIAKRGQARQRVMRSFSILTNQSNSKTVTNSAIWWIASLLSP
jgi:hypothetical protein